MSRGPLEGHKITIFHPLGGDCAPFEGTCKPRAECDPSKQLGDAAQSSSSKNVWLLTLGKEDSLMWGRLDGLKELKEKPSLA